MAWAVVGVHKLAVFEQLFELLLGNFVLLLEVCFGAG
jgi:hypothetical protein